MKKITVSSNIYERYTFKSRIRALIYVYKLLKNNDVYDINISNMFFK